MALISVGVDHQRQVRLRGTLALIAVIWSASDVGYYLGLPAVGLRLDYNAAPITIAFYYAFWVAFTGITFWPVYRQWQPFENRWSGYVLLALAVIGMGAFAAYVLPMLPPIDWPEAWESPELALATPWYFLRVGF